MHTRQLDIFSKYTDIMERCFLLPSIKMEWQISWLVAGRGQGGHNHCSFVQTFTKYWHKLEWSRLKHRQQVDFFYSGNAAGVMTFKLFKSLLASGCTICHLAAVTWQYSPTLYKQKQRMLLGCERESERDSAILKKILLLGDHLMKADVSSKQIM